MKTIPELSAMLKKKYPNDWNGIYLSYVTYSGGSVKIEYEFQRGAISKSFPTYSALETHIESICSDKQDTAEEFNEAVKTIEGAGE